MNDQEIRMLKRKRELCKSHISVTDTQLARGLQEQVASDTSEWTFHEGERLRSVWGNSCSEPLTREQFIHTRHKDGTRDHTNDLLCTFADMISVELTTDAEDGDLVKLVVNEGEGLTGRWRGVRCEIYLKGPWWTIKEFQKRIEVDWIAFTRYTVESEERARLEHRRKIVAQEILGDVYDFPVLDGEVNKDDDE